MSGESSDAESILLLADLADRISQVVPSGLCIIAIDGPGGAGKSTLARRLQEALGRAAVVPTDDFASWDEPLSWWPRMLEEVLQPARTGKRAITYRPYDWVARELGEPRELSLDRFLIVEGVSSGRAEFLGFLDYVIWVETPPDERLRRGLERDGTEMLAQWREWMAAEDRYLAEQQPARRADLLVAGNPHSPHDPVTEVVVILGHPS